MRHSSTRLFALLLVAVIAAAIVVVVAVATNQGGRAGAPQQPRPGLAVYEERSPHVLSELYTYALQSTARGARSTPSTQLAPVPAADFNAPVASYLAFGGKQLGLMEGQITLLERELAAGDRARAEDAWRGAFTHYLELGAVYLEGPIATLDEAIDGNPGGIVGGTASPHFSGLHRLEFGLWTGAPLPSLVPWARRLAVNVRELRKVLPGVQISPLDYATRAHEILEDAVRDLLSGTDVPWSGDGVLGTAAGITATQEVISTLRPLLLNRENVLPVVYEQLTTLQSAMAAIRAAHHGQIPTNGQLTQNQAELLDSAMGGELEALAQVPGALESVRTPVIPAIPQRDEQFNPVDP